MSYKGRFKPKNYKKYKGDPTKVTYRSMWELRFMKYCDKNDSILEWSSEEIVIPYRSIDNKIHRYYPDFWIKYKNFEGKMIQEIIEVKPKKQCIRPTKKGNIMVNIFVKQDDMQSMSLNGMQRESFV